MAHQCKVLELRRGSTPIGRYRLVSFGKAGNDRPFSLCQHAHETVDEAARCPEAHRVRLGLDMERSLPVSEVLARGLA